MVERSRRKFSEPGRRGRGLRDSDVGERVTRLRVTLAGLYGGALGGLAGYFLVRNGSPPWVAVVCFLAGSLAVILSTRFLVGSAGSAASTLYAPASGALPRRREHSRAESLVARGMYREALDAFEAAVAEDPSDPTPYLRIARVRRDHLGEPEEAARWFRRALHDAALPAGAAIAVRRELVELYTHRMRTPERALPELARMAEELAGTPEGEWAAATLREIKGAMS